MEKAPISKDFLLDEVEQRRRRRIALGVVLSVIIFAEIVHGSIVMSWGPIISRLSFLAIELPILFSLVSFVAMKAAHHRWSPLRSVVSMAFVSAFVGAICFTLFFVVSHWLLPFVSYISHVGLKPGIQVAGIGALIGLMHLGIWSLAFVLPFAFHDARLRAVEAEKLQSMAELARLRSHLEPHFILNTLNAIAGLVTEEPKEARRLLSLLGDLLRDALREGNEEQSVADEVAWLKRYTAILESRHRGLLQFQWSVDEAAKNIILPRLLLQPLVENAVRHGALRNRDGGFVRIRIQCTNDQTKSLRVEIEDSGPGWSGGPTRDGAIGLRMVRRRLELRYPQSVFELTKAEDGGALARIEISNPVTATTDLTTGTTHKIEASCMLVPKRSFVHSVEQDQQ